MTLQLYPSPIFRAYDIRGIYPSEISEELFVTLGKCFGSEILQRGGKTVCVGYDGRSSSESLEKALRDGLVSTGVTVYRIGCCPSPLLYFTEKKLQTDGALMITGSHNPKEYNGIKMILNHQPFFGQMIQEFGQKALARDFVEGKGGIIFQPMEEAYLSELLEDYQGHYNNGKKLRVAWDPGHGAAGPLLERLVSKLPGEHFIINGTIDGHFPAHDPDPTIPANLEQLKRLVLEQQCDVGIAFDGDADRIGVIDNQGHFIWGDQFLLLYAEEVLRTYPGATVLADVKASEIFFDKVKEYGGNPLMVSTGHSNIKHKMRETSALLAGEMSGHVFFADRYYGYDDALYAALRLLGTLSLTEHSLSTWRQSLPHLYNTPEIKIPCADHLKKMIIEQVRLKLEQQKKKYSSIDGVRVKDESGWWLLRASNTQDYLIARVEAKSKEGLEALQQQLLACLSDAGIETRGLL